jgi:geranylgeranylglycerol-phosphate geranylgeranyltransferase
VFVPTYSHTGNLYRSLVVSIPLIPISLCTFILNDLNDIERDRINHPGRPLAAGLLLPRTAAIIYFTAFAVSLAFIHFALEEWLRYVYVAGFLLAINYNTVVDYIPTLKKPYVALAATLPIVLVTLIVDVKPNINVLLAAFSFVLGRELLMDIRDLKGDGSTVVRLLPPKVFTSLAFCLQGLGALSLIVAVRSPLELAAAALATILLMIITYNWKNKSYRPILLYAMKLQMLSVIAFLI